MGWAGAWAGLGWLAWPGVLGWGLGWAGAEAWMAGPGLGGGEAGLGGLAGTAGWAGWVEP